MITLTVTHEPGGWSRFLANTRDTAELHRPWCQLGLKLSAVQERCSCLGVFPNTVTAVPEGWRPVARDVLDKVLGTVMRPEQLQDHDSSVKTFVSRDVYTLKGLTNVSCTVVS